MVSAYAPIILGSNLERLVRCSGKKKVVDFREIIHIVDTDGAYISDAAVAEDPDVVEPVYSVTEVHTNNPDGIIYRNQRKRENINRLKPDTFGEVV